MTRGELRTRLLYALHEDPEAPVVFDAEVLNQSLLEAMETLSEQMLVSRTVFTIPRRKGTMLYPLGGVGDAIQCPWRIWLPDLHRRLEPLTIHDLDVRHERWMTITGEPFWWFPVDWQTFGIWPIPTEGGGLMEIDCYIWPTALIDDGDEWRDLDIADHELLLLYGEAEGYLRQWDVDRATDLWQQFQARVQQSVPGANPGLMHARDYVRPTRQGRSPAAPW